MNAQRIGSSPDTLFVRANDGTDWSIWSNPLTATGVSASNSATIAGGSALALNGAFSGPVTFQGSTGILQIGAPTNFTGTGRWPRSTL